MADVPKVFKQSNIYKCLQNILGLTLIFSFLTFPNPKYVFVSLALWILISTVLTALSFKARWNAANIVTFSRALGLVTCSFTLAYHQSIHILVLFLLGVCLLADALDGYLARRFTSSFAGKILDGETDQQFVFLTATTSYILTPMPFWILLFPAIKYIFEIIYILLNLKLLEANAKKRRKTIAAVVMFILLLNLTTLLQKEVIILVTFIGFLFLLYSFCADIIQSIKEKRVY